MAEMKTQRNDASVADFIANADPTRRADCEQMLAILQEEVGVAAMFGDSIVGCGEYKYKKGRREEVTWFVAGFSPRKGSFTIYLSGGYDEQKDLMAKLGKFKVSVACLYVNKLADIDLDVLRQMVRRNTEVMRRHVESK
ncbi:MAG: DUF1801 domain-containing protein [Chthonomonas sp.]|nr:DUF1801 domain-containing protein [Chthonomonas sp.]